jgi:hypothetical protein
MIPGTLAACDAIEVWGRRIRPGRRTMPPSETFDLVQTKSKKSCCAICYVVVLFVRSNLL